jgi:hypothetical protein
VPLKTRSSSNYIYQLISELLDRPLYKILKEKSQSCTLWVGDSWMQRRDIRQ